MGAYRGFKEGVILEIAGFLGFFLALFGAFQLLDSGISVLSSYQEMNNGLIPVMAFIFLFIIILVSVHIIGRLLKTALHITPFGLIDNILGAFLGILKWAFGISLIFWLLSVLEISLPEEQINNSIVVPYITKIAPVFMDLIVYVVPYFQELLSSIEVLFRQTKN